MKEYLIADNDTTNGATYLRNCDSQSNALVQLSTEIVEHGGSDPTDTKESPPCDPDGSYAPKQCETYECHCSTKANERIPPYNTERPSKEEISQNCCTIFFFKNKIPLIAIWDPAD